MSAEPSLQSSLATMPTAFQLHAAVLAAKTFDEEGNTTKSLHASYQGVISGGLYRVQDLKRGQQILERASLVRTVGSMLTPTQELLAVRQLPADVASELLLRALLLVERPLWLYVAVADEDIAWDKVPASDQSVLTQLIADAARRETFLLTIAKTIDLKFLADLGTEGEQFVVGSCRDHLCLLGRSDLASDVHQVSLQSDQLGYDVTSPDTAGVRHRIEVKTMGAALGRAEFFLSRNEARVSRNDPNWSLVVVQRHQDGSLELLGWCTSHAFAHVLPHDPHPHGRWSSVRISLPLEELTPGLPLDAA